MLMQLEAMRAARVKQEEALALMQVESSVQTLQQMDRIKQKQESMVRQTVTVHNWFIIKCQSTHPGCCLFSGC